MSFLNYGILLDSKYYRQTPWLGHISFAGWIMEEHKPKTFVELGTHCGDSYTAFCRAVLASQLSTQCFAIDTWKGDMHTLNYEEEVYESYNQYHQAHFITFSKLMRMTFDEALPYFKDESIDLLHIDGLHTYEAVKHDFETWLPKMSNRGIVLFHDTNEKREGFGVWRLWAELIKIYPAFDFKHSHGLGVLLVGSEISENIKKLTNEDYSKEKALFSHIGQIFNLKHEVQNLKEQILCQKEELIRVRDDFQNSFSWKVTAPYRFLSEKFKLKFRKELSS